jgi:hypothetical protein
MQVLGIPVDRVQEIKNSVLEKLETLDMLNGETVIETLVQEDATHHELIVAAYLLGCIITDRRNSPLAFLESLLSR